MDFLQHVETWDQFMVVAGHSPRTRQSRRALILQLSRAGINPVTASTTDILSWLSRPNLAAASRKTYRTSLKGWFGFLRDNDIRGDDPMSGVPKIRVSPGQPRPLTPGQLQTLFDSITDPRSRHVVTYCQLGYFAGLRLHEIAKMRGEHIDRDAATLTVTGKGSRIHCLPLHPILAAAAAQYPTEGYWFPSKTSLGHVLPNTVGIGIRRAMRRAGIVATPHALRHSFATHIYCATGDIAVTSKALRHADISTTMIYAAVRRDRLGDAIGSLTDVAA